MNREFIKYNGKLHRIIKEDGERSLIIDCKGTRLPQWTDKKTMESLSETEIIDSDVIKGILAIAEAELETSQTAIMNKRFTMIAAILPVIENKQKRAEQMKTAAKRYGVSIVTIRTYLCRYLVSQSKNGLVIFYDESKEEAVHEVKELTKDQKNMRWALNKFYYNTKKNSLNHAYINLLKEKYLDENGVLLEEHPSFYQFRYFFRKTRDCQNEIISRYGLNYFKKNERLCVGDGVRAFATGIGMGMLDSTICDLYLVVAPNIYEEISFDDFVMFSRSCVELATYIFEKMEYDYAKIVKDIPHKQVSKWRKYSKKRQERALYSYINTLYKADETLIEQIPELINILY